MSEIVVMQSVEGPMPSEDERSQAEGCESASDPFLDLLLGSDAPPLQTAGLRSSYRVFLVRQQLAAFVNGWVRTIYPSVEPRVEPDTP